jgi:hypothetical protein
MKVLYRVWKNKDNKVKQSRYRPGVAQRVPGLGSQIFIIFGT